MLKTNNAILELDWGVVTTDFYNDGKKEAIHVFNHYLESKESIDLTIQFIYGKIIWTQKQLPDKAKQIVIIDDRGQKISDEERMYITNALNEFCFSINFYSERV